MLLIFCRKVKIEVSTISKVNVFCQNVFASMIVCEFFSPSRNMIFFHGVDPIHFYQVVNKSFRATASTTYTSSVSDRIHYSNHSGINSHIASRSLIQYNPQSISVSAR